MAERVMTDQPGVRFGIGVGLLFALSSAIAGVGLSAAEGIAVLLMVTVLGAVWSDRLHAIGLGLAGWAFATGFAVNSLGVLTWTPYDMVRLVGFVVAATVSTCLGRRAWGDPA